VRKLLLLLLNTLGYRALWLARKIEFGKGAQKQELAERRVATWYADPRWVTLLYDYPLDADARVIDVGGYEGDWTAEMLMRFRCCVDVFEPVPEFADQMRRRFAFTERVTVHEFGLGARDARLPLEVGGERSSFLHGLGRNSRVIEAEIRDVVAYLDDAEIERADVLKLNIEGAEYELLERLLGAGRASTFEFILIQFHDELPDAHGRAEAIERRLGETHDLMWRFPFVWESWRRRDAV
jgi:FkbM family methyltransferase